VRIALVTTPWSSRSGIADYTRHLLPYLRARAEVDLFVEIGREGEECGEEEPRSVDELVPRDYDRILYQLGNEAQHAFMVPLVRRIGGTVVLHDWVLFDLAMAAYPELQRGGLRGLRRAFQEGGAAEARVYLRGKRRPPALARGWYSPEEDGRWCAARAPLETEGAERLRGRVHVPKGRTLVALQAGAELGRWAGPGDHELELGLDETADPLLHFHVEGAGPPRGGADPRVLGAFFKGLDLRHRGVWEPTEPETAVTVSERGLSADRFELALNRSIVRHADGFLVHSDCVGERILASRNAPTPISRVHHGVEERWADVDRVTRRAEIGLEAAWHDALLIGTLGAVQVHKRPAVLLEALRLLAGSSVDARLLWIGEERPEEFDLVREAERLGLDDRVIVTGWLAEEDAQRALAAADVSVHLRGPSTLGTSGGACQGLSVGLPGIVSDLPELAHLPGECVLRVPQNEDEAKNLAEVLIDIDEDPALRAELEAAARRKVEEEFHWRHAADRYLDVLETHPRARASRRSLLVRFLHATARERKEPATAGAPQRD